MGSSSRRWLNQSTHWQVWTLPLLYLCRCRAPRDNAVLRPRSAEARRRRAEEDVTLLEGSTSGSASRAIIPGKIQQFGDAIRQALQSGSLEFRRAYVRLIVSRVVVGDDEIRVSGSTGALARAAAKAPAQPLQAESSHFDRVWRPLGTPLHRIRPAHSECV